MGIAPHLYLHCGWPRTGTSSFQAVLAGQRDRLAEADVVYPDGWRPRNSDAHYGIGELLDAVAGEGGVAIEGFLDYLRSNGGRKVLISNEALSNWLPAERRGSLIELLCGAETVARVTCLWTLRRLDRWAASMYLHLIETGRSVPPPAEYFLEWAAGVADVFAGMSEVSDALDGRTIYSRYDSSGAHYREILDAVGIPDPVRAEIEVRLRDGPRLNRGPGQRPDLVEAGVSEMLHEQALEAARAANFEPYVEYFGKQVARPR